MTAEPIQGAGTCSFRPRYRLSVLVCSPSSEPPMSDPVVAVDQLVKIYKTTHAVDGISFALEQGSITGLLGGNGAGKTTTIAMILGLVLPTSGSVRVAGRLHRWT